MSSAAEPLPGRLGPPKFSANNSIMPPHAQQKGVVPKKLNANEKSSSGIVLEISNINPDATPQDVEVRLV